MSGRFYNNQIHLNQDSFSGLEIWWLNFGQRNIVGQEMEDYNVVFRVISRILKVWTR